MNIDYINKIKWEVSSLIEYPYALSYMEEKVALIANNNEQGIIWSLEHPALYTAGVSSKESDLLDPTKFPIYNINRGGKYTYHGPGQLIYYLMLDLKQLFAPSPPDIRRFVNLLEDWVILSLDKIGIKAEKREDRIGIWVNNKGKEEKIAAIGIKVTKWVTYHGIAININPNIDHFSAIIPCGIKEYGVTSIENMGVIISRLEFEDIMRETFVNMIL